MGTATVLLPETTQFIATTRNQTILPDVSICLQELSGDFAMETVTTADVEEPCWDDLLSSLHSLARYLVNIHPLPYWHGRELDIADDIVQETMRRLLERMQKAARGEAVPVKSAKQMMNTIAYNYYRDLKRHEHRLTRLELYVQNHYPAYEGDSIMHLSEGMDGLVDFDTINDVIDQEAVFQRAATVIKQFPKKQQKALLTDLANMMAFDEQPTPLQAAFLDVDIELRQYKQALPEETCQRTRHISLLSQAYKRVRRFYEETDHEEMDTEESL